MKVITRLTAARWSRAVWLGLSIACVALLLAGRLAQSNGLEAERAAALERAQAYSGVVARTLATVPDGPPPGSRFRGLYTVLRSEVFTDPTAARVLLFGVDGALLFSSDAQTRGDLQPMSPDPGFDDAVDGSVAWRIEESPFTWSTTGAAAAAQEMLLVDVPLRLSDRVQPAAVVRVDFLMRELRAQAQGSWPVAQLVLGVLLLVSVALAVVAFRRPTSAGAQEHGSAEAVPAPSVPASRRAALDAIDEPPPAGAQEEPQVVATEEPDAEPEGVAEPEPEPEPKAEPELELELEPASVGPEREIESEVDGEGTLVRANLTSVEDKPQLSEEEVNDLRSRLAKAAASRKQGPV